MKLRGKLCFYLTRMLYPYSPMVDIMLNNIIKTGKFVGIYESFVVIQYKGREINLWISHTSCFLTNCWYSVTSGNKRAIIDMWHKRRPSRKAMINFVKWVEQQINR